MWYNFYPQQAALKKQQTQQITDGKSAYIVNNNIADVHLLKSKKEDFGFNI